MDTVQRLNAPIVTSDSSPKILLVLGGGDAIDVLAEAVAQGSKIGVLVSYVYRTAWERFVRQLAGRARWDFLMCDCGAHTVHTLGKKLSVDEYCDWLSYMLAVYQPEAYCAMDVIWDEVATRKNTEEMWRKGFTEAFSTYHFPEPEDALRWVAESSTSMIGLGGMRLIPSETRERSLNFALQYVHGKRIHLWVFLDEYFLSRYPIYSSDSSSWTHCVRWGGLSVGNFSVRISRDKQTKNAGLRLAIRQYESLQRRCQAAQQRKGYHVQSV